MFLPPNSGEANYGKRKTALWDRGALHQHSITRGALVRVSGTGKNEQNDLAAFFVQTSLNVC